MKDLDHGRYEEYCNDIARPFFHRLQCTDLRPALQHSSWIAYNRLMKKLEAVSGTQGEVWKRNFWKELSKFPVSLIHAFIQNSHSESYPNLQTAYGMFHIWPVYKEKVLPRSTRN